VDDSKVMRRILLGIVRSLGFEGLEAADGHEAIDVIKAALESGGLDLVLTDWNMPGMDGLDLIRHLRTDGGFDGLQIIMVTSESEITRVEEALASGADEYLMKPFDGDSLADKLGLLGLLDPEPVG
jgi:two-component system chemotaxis response regulator CheY